jgi:hypothetical protein
MAQDKLREFFRQKKASAPAKATNWEARKKEWVKAIEALYETVCGQYLAGAVKDGTVKVWRDSKEIDEDYIGRYTVPLLVLEVGGERVMFSPKGRNVVGAAGRVDLVGDLGQVTIVRQPGGRWAVVETRIPTLKLVELDAKSLLAALKSVMRT